MRRFVILPMVAFLSIAPNFTAHGPSAQARYVEVFPSDAIAYPAAIAAAHAALTR